MKQHLSRFSDVTVTGETEADVIHEFEQEFSGLIDKLEIVVCRVVDVISDSNPFNRSGEKSNREAQIRGFHYMLFPPAESTFRFDFEAQVRKALTEF